MTLMPASIERTSYCLPCDRVIAWKSWRVWQRHLESAEHRECLIAPRPLPPERIREADLEDPVFGLVEGESALYRRPDARWIGLASLGAGATLRIEGSQRSIVGERLARHLGPDARPTKHLCLRCRLILDPVVLGHHNATAGHRANKDPLLGDEPLTSPRLQSPLEPPPAAPLPAAPSERVTVAMAPLLLALGDAARILGVSKSTTGQLARDGTIPSLRLGGRVLIPVKALEEWIESRLKEDSERYRAPWSRIRAYGASHSVPTPARTRRSPRWPTG